MISSAVTYRLASRCAGSALFSHLRPFSCTAKLRMPIKVGEKVPDITLYEGSPKGEVNTTALLAGKKAIIFAVPGAFTPGCTVTHLPGYVSKAEGFKAAGVDVVACVSVNDPFVMEAWGQANGAEGKVRMLADPRAELAKAVGLEKDLTAALGNVRSSRYSMIVVDGVVKALNVEPDGTGLTCSLAPNLLQQLANL